MADEHWQVNCGDLKNRNAHLLKEGLWSDCEFLVGEQDPLLLKGHKVILAAASPVFAAMLYGNMAERDGPIRVPDVQPEAFKSLLTYIYTDTGVNSFDDAYILFYVAKKYMLVDLNKKCIECLYDDVVPSNACCAFELGLYFDEFDVVHKCIEIIGVHTFDVIQHQTFNEINPETLVRVLSMDILTIDSELDLFRAVERYAKSHGIYQYNNEIDDTINLSTLETYSDTEVICVNSGSSEGDIVDNTVYNDCAGPSIQLPPPITHKVDHKMEQARVLIRQALEQIRFLTLTPQQFALGPANSDLLTQSDKYAILLHLVSENVTIALPADFSVSREKRVSSCD